MALHYGHRDTQQGGLAYLRAQAMKEMMGIRRDVGGRDG